MSQNTVVFRIKRQENPAARPHWEEFAVPYREKLNVIVCLNEIRRHPVTRDGRKTTPVAWECACLEEVCGSCAMIINGKARPACSALIDELKQPITLEPMAKFPVVRDLVVDRSRMFDALKKVRAWVQLDGTWHLGPAPRWNERERFRAYDFSRCMTCGVCLEVCPQINARSSFVGAAAIGQVRLFNSHPLGGLQATERLDALMDKGGIAECGNAQNCVEACPKDISLVDAIGEVNRQMARHTLKKILAG
ncbi:MAG: succinate dehydrogenase iron-sulfur subunit [Candidatus Krumholzibacteriota bacterium]|nr:succinate dehydrogenase iron-sulfur subunit [Candidatus Krumholzibacteriota bacterium]